MPCLIACMMVFTDLLQEYLYGRKMTKYLFFVDFNLKTFCIYVDLRA